MLAQGVPLKVVQAILGHSQIGQTADTYTHVLPELHDEAAERQEALLRRLAGEAAAAGEAPEAGPASGASARSRTRGDDEVGDKVGEDRAR
jgi:hypothetical protein